MSSVILPNVAISDNVIIGACSVVAKDCASSGVYAGVPVKRICGLDEYCKRRKDAQVQEAKQLATEYFKRYGKRPKPEVFHEYFMLFETTESVITKGDYCNKMQLCENYETSLDYMKTHPPVFQSFNAFMKWCFDKTQ